MTEKVKRKRGRPKKKQEPKAQETEKVQKEDTGEIDENKYRQEAKVFVDELVSATKEPDLSKMPLDTVEDYQAYNHEARRQKRPVKFPPLSMFQYIKTKIVRADGQKDNPIHVRIRDAELLIDFDEELSCKEPVEIPYPVMEWLNRRAVKKYKQVKYPDGSAETLFSHYEPRFSCQMAL